MGLRNRSSLKRCADGGAEKNQASGSSERTKRRTALKRVAVQLVSSDPLLGQFLRTEPSPKPSETSPKAAHTAAVARVEKAVSALGKLEAEVIEALFPSSGAAPETFEDLAKRLGMTVEEVKGVADNALRGLRGPRHSAPRISTVWN